MEKPLILITNDDGVDAKGIQCLTNFVQDLADVIVVAPNGPRSGQSSAITVDRPLRLRVEAEEEGLTVYSCSGTPVDCVKLALNKVMDRYPDLVLSGINHGLNTSVSVIYSGTMGGAMEGAIHGIPSIGFSLDNYSKDADFELMRPVVRTMVNNVLSQGLPAGVCLNVNAPNGEIKGIEVCRQARGKWSEEFETRVDPHNREYYWLSGYFDNAEVHAQDTDEHLIKRGYVSVVPTSVDTTDYTMLDELKNWNL
ncbi:5'/3'-nucleotidase SurE [Halosquirtibacter xylanolyticus]|uniref:5'/3'-nucleotidase SurE n=1 Tax=Halosquirtibacter xylanolyticus TaxID=3374599 RepID=UPI0037494752|nr:5'/3'-nucleotidase SurE [Prolixibacteraceae bacterium]